MEVGDPGEVRYLTYPCKEILVFTCNLVDAGRGLPGQADRLTRLAGEPS